MSMHPVSQRPDLRPLFGALTDEENGALLDQLQLVDDDLAQLAAEASAHVGVPYREVALHLSLRPDGTARGIDGGPSGEAGDIWFDISGADGIAGPPWSVESRLVVFCADSPEPRGESSTHDLVRLEATCETPTAVVEQLQQHVSAMRIEVLRHPREGITSTRHARLP